MRKTIETTPLETACYNLAEELRKIALERCADQDIHSVHYIVTEMNRVQRLAQTMQRRFGV
jgi:hypothetical protein